MKTGANCQLSFVSPTCLTCRSDRCQNKKQTRITDMVSCGGEGRTCHIFRPVAIYCSAQIGFPSLSTKWGVFLGTVPGTGVASTGADPGTGTPSGPPKSLKISSSFWRTPFQIPLPFYGFSVTGGASVDGTPPPASGGFFSSAEFGVVVGARFKFGMFELGMSGFGIWIFGIFGCWGLTSGLTDGLDGLPGLVVGLVRGLLSESSQIVTVRARPCTRSNPHRLVRPGTAAKREPSASRLLLP